MGPTNHRGARVKATSYAGSVTVHWNHSMNVEENHRTAALTLTLKLGWRVVGKDFNYTGGQLADGSYVWVTP